MNTVIKRKQGDTSQWPTITLNETVSGVTQAADLSSATAVVLYMRVLGGTTNKIDGATCAVVGDGTAGQITFTPTAAQMDTAGTYRAEFKVTFSDGTITTWPDDAEFDTDEDFVRVEIAENLQ